MGKLCNSSKENCPKGGGGYECQEMKTEGRGPGTGDTKIPQST